MGALVATTAHVRLEFVRLYCVIIGDDGCGNDYRTFGADGTNLGNTSQVAITFVESCTISDDVTYNSTGERNSRCHIAIQLTCTYQYRSSISIDHR